MSFLRALHQIARFRPSRPGDRAGEDDVTMPAHIEAELRLQAPRHASRRTTGLARSSSRVWKRGTAREHRSGHAVCVLLFDEG
jgi:hypothetical protein